MASSAATCSRWFFARAFFYPEDGGDTILRNVISIDHIYTAPHPRRRHSYYYFLLLSLLFLPPQLFLMKHYAPNLSFPVE
jgi:hypothetical protein